MTDFYILEGKEVIAVPDATTWALWYERANRRVAETIVEPFRISTVFLGLDHSFTLGMPPLVFETMVFAADSYSEEDLARYSTWDEAVAGHEAMVAKVKLAQQQEHLP